MYTFAMITYSQKDPKYKDLKIGSSKLTIGEAGCVVMSIATLMQVDPTVILAIPGAFTPAGWANIGVIMKALGGEALPATNTPPKGWCMAVTDNFAPQFPTHFFPMSADSRQQVDPLDNPAKVEVLGGYRVTQYRPLKGIKFDPTQVPAPGPFADVPLSRPDAAAIGRLKAKGYVNGYGDGTYHPDAFMTRGEAAVLIDRALNG